MPLKNIIPRFLCKFPLTSASFLCFKFILFPRIILLLLSPLFLFVLLPLLLFLLHIPSITSDANFWLGDKGSFIHLDLKFIMTIVILIFFHFYYRYAKVWNFFFEFTLNMEEKEKGGVFFFIGWVLVTWEK